MASQHSRYSVSQRIVRSVRYTVLLLGACLLCMALSYHAVLWYLEHRDFQTAPPVLPASEAEQLRGFSKELTDLLRVYLDRISREGEPPSEEFARWAVEDFCPRVNQLRLRIQASTVFGEALNALLSASDRVYAMANQPGQVSLRQLATDNVFEATAAVESRLAFLGLEAAPRPAP